MVVDRAIPSWKALEWLVEDYSLSMIEKTLYDKIYEQISADWQ